MEENDIRTSINKAVNGIETEKLGEDVRSCIGSAIDSSEEYMTENLNFIEELNSKMDEYHGIYNEAETAYKEFCDKLKNVSDLYDDIVNSYNAFKDGPWGKIGKL